MPHTELHQRDRQRHNSIEKHLNISTINQPEHGDKARPGVYQGTRVKHCPYGKRSQQGSLFIM
ncbi:hypothetical protein A9R10_05345 [Aeromonas piscicola]|nr:hypothetical protein A9R10_05345 [Aeromonas piscicola]